MKQYVICAEGGACGNFIATLIRTMWNPDHYKTYKSNITSNGSCDHMAFAAKLQYDYLIEHKKINLYPETEKGVQEVLTALKDPHNTYDLLDSEEMKKFDRLHVIHYSFPDTIKRMLEIPNVYVIQVLIDEKDLNLATYNKIYKNFEVERNDKIKNILKDIKASLIRKRNIKYFSELEKVTNLAEIPKEIIDIALEDMHKYLSNRIKIPIPAEHEKMLTLHLDEVYNSKDELICKLSKFIGASKNESTDELFDTYMKAQEPILNLLKNNHA